MALLPKPSRNCWITMSNGGTFHGELVDPDVTLLELHDLLKRDAVKWITLSSRATAGTRQTVMYQVRHLMNISIGSSY